MTMIEGNGKI